MAIKIKFNFARGRHEMQLNLQKERGFLPQIPRINIELQRLKFSSTQ